MEMQKIDSTKFPMTELVCWLEEKRKSPFEDKDVSVLMNLVDSFMAQEGCRVGLPVNEKEEILFALSCEVVGVDYDPTEVNYEVN